MLPLDLAIPNPLVREIIPPVFVVALPPNATISPPLDAVLKPPLNTIAPDLPFAPFAVPVEILTVPLLPVLVVPVLNCRDPLTPATPAFADLTTIKPDDLAVPTPELKDKKPPVPVALVVDPPFTDTNPDSV